MSLASLERQRAASVSAAEQEAGMIDGGRYYYDGLDGKMRWVRVHVQFYPKKRWMVEDIDDVMSPEPIKGTLRPFAEFQYKLQSWL